MMVLGCSASNGIEADLARELGTEAAKVETTRFPDGEIKVMVPDTGDNDVVVVQSTCAPQEKNIIELLFAADVLRGRKARVTAVVPYLAYARQNKSFRPGEAVSVDVVLEMMHAAGIDRLVTVNPHKVDALSRFKGALGLVDSEKRLAGSIKGRLRNPLVFAPDHGSLDMARNAAATLGCSYTYIDKRRDADGSVSITGTHGGDFKGKDVIIFDDIISTGGTIVQAAGFAYGEGAASVSAAGIHLVMADGAMERLRSAGIEKVFGTNTIPCDKAEIVNVSPDIAECIRRL